MSSPRQAFPGTPTKWLPQIERGAVISTGSPSTSSPGRPPRRCWQVLIEPTGSHRTPSRRSCFRRRRPAGSCPDSGNPHLRSAMICPASSHPNPSSPCSSATCTVPTDPDCCENCEIAGQSSALPVCGRRPTRPITACCRLANSTVQAIPERSTPTTRLVELVLGADREAADDLRRKALAPLEQLRPNTAERLAETLRSWLLHRGQRDAVAADLFVHAQTVRYRMTQLRELFGERLNDPATVLELIVALSIPTAIDSPAAP